MAYDSKVVQAARSRLEQRRTDAVNRAASLRTEMCARYPRLREIEQELTAALPEVTRIILEGGDAQALETVRSRNLALQEEMTSILRQAGCAADNFEPRYTCPLCGDTGYTDAGMCDCFRRLLKEEACRQLSELTSLKLTDFESLDATLYDDTPDPKLGTSPRQRMRDIIAYCRSYAAAFEPGADSLLLQGATGTGKTHLSLAIAGEVVGRGYGVVYGSIQPLLRRIESEHFGRSEGNTEDQLIGCDLLVLDDLGMELDTPFYRASLYSILDSRILEGRPTIISTNLGYSAIRERYGDQIASRITGGFVPLCCVGSDIRQLLRRRELR